ncbi:MAG: hypothetical protein ACK5NN_11365 [Sphingomonadaceae bacterium]
MAERSSFFSEVRRRLFRGRLTQGQVDGLNAILDASEGLPVAWRAYMLATAHHEVNRTMQPIREIGNAAYFTRMYDIEGRRPHVARELGNVEPGDGARFHGRGYVQLTGRANYQRADDELTKAGLIAAGALMTEPDLAMRPDIAAFIMREGMLHGWFTGRNLARYLPSSQGTLAQFEQARRIINRMDKARTIAGYAIKYQEAL